MTRRISDDRISGRQGALIDVASAQLNTMGVSLEWFGAIATELGISRPALYKYVANREDLVFKCYLRSCAIFEDALDRSIEASSDPVKIIESFLSYTSDPDLPEIAVLSEIDTLRADKQTIVISRRDRIVGRIAGAITRGVEHGAFRPLDPLIAAEAIFGMASWAPLYRRWGTEYSLVKGAAGMKQILFRGLAAERSQAFRNARPRVKARSTKLDLFDPEAVERERRETILATASGLLNRRGIGATRLEDVGAAIGLDKRAIYRQIGDKAALIDACVERAIAFYLALMDAAEGSALPRMEAYCASVSAIVIASCDPDRSVLVPYVGFGLLSRRSQTAMKAFSSRLTEGYRKILSDGVTDGSVRPLPLEDVLASLPGVFSWVSNARPLSSRARVKAAEELSALTALGMLR